MKAWNALMEERQSCMDTPMKPQLVAWEVGKRLKSMQLFLQILERLRHGWQGIYP